MNPLTSHRGRDTWQRFPQWPCQKMLKHDFLSFICHSILLGIPLSVFKASPPFGTDWFTPFFVEPLFEGVWLTTRSSAFCSHHVLNAPRTWYTISNTLTRLNPMQRPKRPPVLATKAIMGIFWSRKILVTTGSLMYTLTTAKFCFAYWKMSSSRLEKENGCFITWYNKKVLSHNVVDVP